MNVKIKRFAPLITMLIFPFLGMLYALVNRPNQKVYSLMTGIDEMIPFVKIFVVPYSVWIFYIYVCLVYFFIKDPKVYFRSLITYTISALTCYLIYLVFQTTVPRPTLTGDDIVTQLMAYVYQRDRPFNCFPSIHCFSSYMVMKALYTSGFRNWKNQTFIYGMSSLIILSTFFVKQHVILDAIGGILLVELVWWLVVRFDLAKMPFFGKVQSSKTFNS